MRREREEKLARQMENDARDDSLWEADPAPTEKRARLGVQVSVRLDPDSAAILRRLARARRVGYTSLIREWVVARLREESQDVEGVLLPQASIGGVAATGNATVTGSIRRVRSEEPTLLLAG
ncbi:MAG: ribbon-helix-helix protein, CopG family [Chloroflexi bacterium]|nr:ribbon-helix-helix protein, CopG family [Chloroflexota bacterium]